jgi:hypothetical protein
MAKDALGHGSDGNGVHAGKFNSLPKAPAVFGKRHTIPPQPPVAHQSRIMGLLSDFSKSETGSGKVPPILEDSINDPDRLADAGEAVASSLAESKIDTSAFMHFLHFLAFLGGIAVIDVIGRCAIDLLGS